MYEKNGNIEELKRIYGQAKQGLFKLTSVYSQYRKNEASDFLSSFTIYDFELLTEKIKKRAYFIVVGEVSSRPSGLNCGGQRFMVTVRRENDSHENQESLFEFWSPGEKLELPKVSEGDTVRVKGLVRQKEPDGLCGGDGPVRAYLETLEIVGGLNGDDIPY